MEAVFELIKLIVNWSLFVVFMWYVYSAIRKNDFLFMFDKKKEQTVNVEVVTDTSLPQAKTKGSTRAVEFTLRNKSYRVGVFWGREIRNAN